MSPSGNNQNSADLRFNATLQDNVSPAADQIAKKMKELGATNAQIKIFVKAYDDASVKVKNVQDQVKKLPKEHHIHVQAHTEDAHKKISELHKIAAAPVHVVVRMKDETEQTVSQVSNRVRNLKSELTNMISTMPVLGLGIQGVQNVSQTASGMAGQGLGIGGLGTGVAGVASAGAAIGVLQKSFDVNNQMQQQLVTLQSTLKDKTQAQAEMQSNVSYALRTPFNLPDVQAADVQLRALGVPRTSPINIKAVGNMAAAVHRKPQDAAQALAEAYRGDFALLPGYGVTLHQSDFSAGGRFAGQSYERGVSQLVKQRFGGATSLQAQTLSGVVSNIQDVTNQQIIGGAGRPLFNTIQGVAQKAETKMTSVGFQQDIGPKIDKVQTGIARLWETLQRGKEYFQTNLEQPLKNLITTLVHVGHVFASTFGSVVLTGVKTLGEAFSAIVTPLSKLVQAHPLLVQMFAVMKGFQMLGMNKMASPFEGFFHSINPLSFSITGLIKSIGGLLLLAPKLAVIFTIKNILDMHSATEALTNSFDKFHQGGSRALDSLQFKLDAMSGSMGKTAAEMKQFAAEIANLTPASMSAQQRADFSQRGAENMAIMDQQGFGKQAGSLFKQKLGTINPELYNQKVSDEAFREVTQSIKGVSKALGIDLPSATKLAADALVIFADSLSTRGLNNVQGGALAGTLSGALQGIPITPGQLKAGIHTPNELVKSLLDRSAQPSAGDIQLLERLSKQSTRPVIPGMPSNLHMPLVPGLPFDLNSLVQFNGTTTERGVHQLRQYSHQDDVLRAGLRRVDQQASSLTGMNIHLPNAPSQFQANKIGVDFSKLTSPQGQAQEWIRLSHVVDQVGKAYSAAQQHSAQLQDQQTRLGETQEIVNKKFQNFQYSLLPLSRAIEDLSLQMGRFQLSVLRPLERDMTRLQNTMAVYQHSSVVPIQRAQEDWNQVMVRTSNRIADVSFHLGKAQFEMGKFSEGLFTGEQKVLDNIHALERYNQQLNLLKLQNMGLQADLTKTTVDQGFSMVVKPLMGFSLEREIQLGQRRQEIAQANYDLKYGEQHYQVGKAARPLFQRQEMSFAQRMAGTKANITVIDQETLANRRLENVQYKQSLTARKLQEQMYQASVGARKYEDAQFALSQKIFKANEHLQNMQDKLSGMQLHLQDVSRGSRKYEDAQHALANQSINLNLQLTETNRQLSQLQGNLEVARDTQGILGKMFFGNIKPGDVHAQIKELLVFIEALRGHGLSNTQADAMEKSLKALDPIINGPIQRGVPWYQKLADGIKSSFVGIFSGRTFVELFDTIKHGITSLGLPKIIADALGVGGASLAGLYAVNAIRLLVQKTIIPALITTTGRSLGSLISRIPGEPSTRVGAGVARSGEWLGNVISKNTPNTLLKPWNWLRGAGADWAGSLVASMFGLHPAAALTAGHGYGYLVEQSRTSAWKGAPIPGPIDVAKGTWNATTHPLRSLENAAKAAAKAAGDMGPSFDGLKTHLDKVQGKLGDLGATARTLKEDIGKIKIPSWIQDPSKVPTPTDPLKGRPSWTRDPSSVPGGASPQPGEPAAAGEPHPSAIGKAGQYGKDFFRYGKFAGPLMTGFDIVSALGIFGGGQIKDQGKLALEGTGIGAILLGGLFKSFKAAGIGAVLGSIIGGSLATNNPILVIGETIGFMIAQRLLFKLAKNLFSGAKQLWNTFRGNAVKDAVTTGDEAGTAHGLAYRAKAVGSWFLDKFKSAFTVFKKWLVGASALAGRAAGGVQAIGHIAASLGSAFLSKAKTAFLTFRTWLIGSSAVAGRLAGGAQGLAQIAGSLGSAFLSKAKTAFLVFRTWLVGSSAVAGRLAGVAQAIAQVAWGIGAKFLGKAKAAFVIFRDWLIGASGAAGAKAGIAEGEGQASGLLSKKGLFAAAGTKLGGILGAALGAAAVVAAADIVSNWMNKNFNTNFHGLKGLDPSSVRQFSPTGMPVGGPGSGPPRHTPGIHTVVNTDTGDEYIARPGHPLPPGHYVNVGPGTRYPHGYHSPRPGRGTHATGLTRVPRDGYKATLHKDEAVLTASQANVWRNQLTNTFEGSIADDIADILDRARGRSINKGSVASGLNRLAGFSAKYAGGIDRVPHDNFLALLHQDETVLPAATSHALRAKKPEDKSAVRDTMDQAKKIKDILDEHFSRVETNSNKHDKALFTRRTNSFDRERVDTRNQHKNVENAYDDHYTKLTTGFSTFTTNKEQTYAAHNTKVEKMVQSASNSQFTTYDKGWHKIDDSTTKWIGKIHKQIANLDKTIGLTGVGPSTKKPPHKAHGGMIKGGHIGQGHLIRVGEEGFDEVVIPLAPHRKDRAESLIKQTKARIGSFAAGGFTGLAGVPKDIKGRGPVGKLTYNQLQADRAKWNAQLSAKMAAANAAAAGGGIKIGGSGHDAALMMSISKQLGWNFQDWWNLDAQETGHGTNLVNPSSTARLRGQFLSMNYGKYGVGSDPNRSPSMDEQIRSMARYIKSRYGNATNAWHHEQSHNWYAAGGIVSGTGAGQGAGHAGGLGTGKLPPAITNVGHGTYSPTTPQDKKDYKSFLELLHKLEKTLPPAQSNALRASESRFGPRSLFGAIHEMFEGSHDTLTDILKKIAKDIKLQKRIALAEVSASVREHIGPKGRVGTVSRTDYFTKQTRHLGAGKFGGQGAQTILDNEIALANQVGLPKLFKQVAADQLRLDTLIGGVQQPNPKKGKPPIVVHGTHAQLRAARALLKRDYSSFKRVRDTWLKEGLTKGVNLTIMQEALAHAQDVSTPTSDQDVSAYLGDNLSVIRGSGGKKKGRAQLARGLARIPRDNFEANLHKDEAVLNAPQASQWRKQQATTETSAQEKTQKKILNTLVESKDLFQKSEYRKIADQIRGKGGSGPGAATGGAMRMDLVKPKVVIDQTGSNALKIDQKPTIKELMKAGDLIGAGNLALIEEKKELKGIKDIQSESKQDIKALEAAAKDTSLTDKQHVAVTNALHATQKAAKLDALAHAATTKSIKELTDAANLQRKAVKESTDAGTAATQAQKELVLAQTQMTAAMALNVTDSTSATVKQSDIVAAQKAILQANNDITSAAALTAKAQLDTQTANNATTKAVADATAATKDTLVAAKATSDAHVGDVLALKGTADSQLLSTTDPAGKLIDTIASGGFRDDNKFAHDHIGMLDNIWNKLDAKQPITNRLDQVQSAVYELRGGDAGASNIVGQTTRLTELLKGNQGGALTAIAANTGVIAGMWSGGKGGRGGALNYLYLIAKRTAATITAIEKMKGWGKAGGFYRVPYDDYPATLHKDEMVLTAAEANVYRGKPDHGSRSPGSGDTSTMEDLLRSINDQLTHQRPPTVNVVNTHKAIQSQIQPQSSYTRTK